jgi:FkbM family methyltransferase
MNGSLRNAKSSLVPAQISLRDGKFFYNDSPHSPPDLLLLRPGLVQHETRFTGCGAAAHVFLRDYDERYEAQMIRRLLDRGETFWDIGANIGYFSLLAAGLAAFGRVIAFEPGQVATPGDGQCALNPFRITTFNLAVTDREGGPLHLAAGTADGCASLYGRAGSRPEICRTVSLDDFLSRRLAGPDFIKSMWRAELFVLGARSFIGFRPGAGGTESRNPGGLGNG